MKNIKILGIGCRSCHQLHENVKAAVKSLDLSVDVEYITDMKAIMDYGVMRTPAIVADGKVVSMGRVLNEAQVKKLLKDGKL